MSVICSGCVFSGLRSRTTKSASLPGARTRCPVLGAWRTRLLWCTGRARPGQPAPHHQPGDPHAEHAPLVGLGVGGQRVAASVGITRRGDAQRREMLPRPGHQTSPRSGAHPLHVPPQATPQQGERRSLVDHPVQPPFAVPPEPAARRVRLPIVEPGLPERGRVQHTRVQRGMEQDRRLARHGGGEVGAGGMPALPELVLHVPAAGHPRPFRRPGGRVPQPRHDRRNIRRRWLAAIRARRQVAHIAQMAMRVDQPRNDGRPCSRITRAPGSAAACTRSADPTAAIRPSRTSIDRAGPGPSAIVTMSASVSSTSTIQPSTVAAMTGLARASTDPILRHSPRPGCTAERDHALSMGHRREW